MRITADMVEDIQEAIQGKFAEILHEQVAKLEGRAVSTDEIKRHCVTITKSNYHGKSCVRYVWRNQKVVSLLDPVVIEDGTTTIQIVKHLEQDKIHTFDASFPGARKIIH